MERLTMLAFLTGLVGAAAVAIAVVPLAVFLAEYNAGRIAVYVENLGGGLVRVSIEYNASVPLAGFSLEVKAFRGGSVYYQASAGDELLQAGETLSLDLNASKLAEADLVSVTAVGSVAGFYPFNLTVTAPLSQLLGVIRP